LGVVTEVMDPRDVERVARYADMLQIGTRNMQNFPLLREVGATRMPVLLKRGLSATVQEWLLAAEYVVLGGNDNVVLCERGVRSFDVATRNLLDISVVPLLEEMTHLPVIVDPSHAMGISRLVPPIAMASLAAGADGLLIEVHPDPANALSDGAQSLNCAQFEQLMRRLGPVAEIAGRRLPKRHPAVSSS
jgi:3-deoxy-7-phosphoheptulonate synthase